MNRQYSNNSHLLTFCIASHFNMSLKKEGQELLLFFKLIKPETKQVQFWYRETRSSPRFARNVMHPTVWRNRTCTMMFLINLADPEWISVDCNKPLLPDIVCFKQKTKPQQVEAEMKDNKLTCFPGAILTKGHCYLFLWFDGKQATKQKDFLMCTQNTTNKIINAIIGNQKLFQKLFSAVSHSSFSVVTENSVQSMLVQQHTFERVWFNMFVESQSVSFCEASGYFACSLPVSEIFAEGIHVFSCDNKQLISSMFILDGHNDCLDKEKRKGLHHDEICTTGMCPAQCDKPGCKCSPLHFMSKYGDCIQYVFQLKNTSEAKHNTSEDSMSVLCKEGQQIASVLLNDLVSDCSGLATDEPLLNDILQNNSFFLCDRPEEIPCKTGHSKCFTISDVCMYKLDAFNNLLPCRTGSHMESCKQFECDRSFKCPTYFCVPWQYLCNGRWDCPLGDDELITRGCLPMTQRTCPHFFRCRSSQICLHVESVCNTISECPMKDDEVFCQLKGHNCPAGCSCLSFAISCTGFPLKVNDLHRIPLQSFHLIGTSITTLGFLTGGNQPVVNLNVSNNLIVHVNDTFAHCSHLLFIDLSINHITTLYRSSFSNLGNLKCLILRNNSLTHVQKCTFHNLSNLEFIDLSFNKLQTIEEETFFKATHKTVLNIFFNSFLNIESKSFSELSATIVWTSTHSVCCFLPAEAKCIVFPDLDHQLSTCSKLLPSLGLTVWLPVDLSSIVILNIVSFVIHIKAYRQTRHAKGGATSGMYELIVIMVNLANIVMGLSFTFVWAADLYFGDNYVLKNDLWRTSLVCFLACFLFLWFSTTVSLLLLLLALARLMITLHPMTTTFKSRTKAKIYAFVTVAASLAVCFVVTFYFYMTGQKLNRLCLLSPEHSIYVLSVTVIHIILSLSIIGLSTLLVKSLAGHEQTVQSINSIQKKWKVHGKCLLVNLPNVLSWLAFDITNIVFGLLSASETETVLWSNAVLAPISGIFNPIYFLVTYKSES